MCCECGVGDGESTRLLVRTLVTGEFKFIRTDCSSEHAGVRYLALTLLAIIIIYQSVSTSTSTCS
jgi:hypothetical protein